LEELQLLQLKEKRNNLKAEYREKFGIINGALDQIYRLDEEFRAERILWQERKMILENLQNCTILAKVFDISTDGVMGMINDLPLGRGPQLNQSTTDQINAALGHITLFIEMVIIYINSASPSHLKYKWAGHFIEHYKFKGLGSKSYIESKEKTILPLYTNPENNLSKMTAYFFFESPFDKALKVLLHTIKEIFDYASSSTIKWVPPNIKIIQDQIESTNPKIGPNSILISNSTPESWNSCMKLVLMVIKSLVDWFDKFRKTPL